MKSTPVSQLSASRAQENPEEEKAYDEPNLKLELDHHTHTGITP